MPKRSPQLLKPDDKNRDEPRDPKLPIGGLAGEIPSSEVIPARVAYGKYLEKYDTQGGEGERLDFPEWVRKNWKVM